MAAECRDRDNPRTTKPNRRTDLKMLLRLVKIAVLVSGFLFWALISLRLIYPYDHALSELAKEQRFVFLYEQQRLAEANEVTDELLKTDKRWNYGIANDLEVLEVSFHVNKKVYFLTTAENDHKPWEDKSGEKQFSLSARTLSACLASQKCGFFVMTGLGDKANVYARDLSAVQSTKPEWQATTDFVEQLVLANIERQELLLAIKRYAIAAAPLLLMIFYLLFQGMRRAKSKQ
jgi:hypothetical protein